VSREVVELEGVRGGGGVERGVSRGS